MGSPGVKDIDGGLMEVSSVQKLNHKIWYEKHGLDIDRLVFLLQFTDD